MGTRRPKEAWHGTCGLLDLGGDAKRRGAVRDLCRRIDDEDDAADTDEGAILVTPVKTRLEAASGSAPMNSPETPGGASPTPFSPGGKSQDHYNGLDYGEHQRLRELRGELNKAAKAEPKLLGTSALRRFASDATLCRYLRARKWHLKKAMKMLRWG
jgi:hypothetical protein